MGGIMIKIKFTDQLPKNIEDGMENDLLKYECSQGIDVNYKL
jgi:hypothetical protein